MYQPVSVQPASGPSLHVATVHSCRACGMTDQDHPGCSFVYRSGASFCLSCWQSLPGAALSRERLASPVPLPPQWDRWTPPVLVALSA